MPARLVLRDPGKMQPSLHQRIYGNLDEPDSLSAAFEGLDVLILVTPEGPRQDRQGIAAIDAGRAAGVRRVVRLSAMLAVTSPGRHFGAQHGMIEEALARSGLDYTILRPSFFMQSFLLFLRDIARGRLIVPVPTGKVAFVDVEDVAEAAVACAAKEIGKGPFVLTGGEALSFGEAAAALSGIGRAQVRHITPPRWVVRTLLSWSEGRFMASNFDYLFRNLEAGLEAEPTSDLESLLGRAPASFNAFLEREMRPALHHAKAA